MTLKLKRILAREFLLILLVIVIGILAVGTAFLYNKIHAHCIENIQEKIMLNSYLADSLSKPTVTKSEKRLWLFAKLRSNNPKFQLWKFLNSDSIRLYSKSYEEFINQYSNNNAREYLWKGMTVKKLTSKEYQQFNQQYFEDGHDLFNSDFQSSEKLWEYLKNIISADSINHKFKSDQDNEYMLRLNKMGFNDSQSLVSYITDYEISKADSINLKKSNSIRNEMESLKKLQIKLQGKLLTSSMQLHVGYWFCIISALLLFPVRYLIYCTKWSIQILRDRSHT